MWLFTKNLELEVPEKSFPDFLGLGLLGDIVGQRSRINSLELGGFKLENVTASFPDSLSVEGLQNYESRNGSIGSELLKRFNLFMDYANNIMHLKKNKHFNDPFNYDMSGIILEHSGFMMVETYQKVFESRFQGAPEDNVILIQPSFYKKYELKPAFRIARLREDSPALLAGLQVGDALISVNGREAHKFTLQRFTSLFSSREGKRIKLEVERGGVVKKYKFRLKKVL